MVPALAKAFLFLGIVAGFFVFDSAAQADIEYWKVVEVTGAVEMKPSAISGWRKVSVPFYLKRGSLVRTGKKGSVDFCLNRQWDSFFRLNENSELRFSEKSPDEIQLKKGSLFALLEGEPVPGSLRIYSGDTAVRMPSGGLAVYASASRTAVMVFSESVEVGDLAVTEGWEWSAGQVRRLDFSDYAEWQRWFRKSYGRKDEFFLKRSL
jgi:hypothetical protein